MCNLLLSLIVAVPLAAQLHPAIERVTVSESASQLLTWTTVLHDADEKIVSEDATYTVDFDKETVARNDRAISAKDVDTKTKIATQARVWSAVRELTVIAGRTCGATLLTTENRVFTLSASSGEFLVSEDNGKSLVSLTPEVAMCPGDVAKQLTPVQSRVAVGYFEFVFRTCAAITDWFSSIVNAQERVKK